MFTAPATRTLRARLATLVGACVLLIAPTGARASLCYNVSINTTAFKASTAGPFAIDFQLNDGSGSFDGNNTAMLTNFVFGIGGGATGSPTLTGGASGSLAGGITITDSQFLNEFTQGFTPGTALNFTLMITTNIDPGPQPDEFTMFLLDKSGTAIPTADPVVGRNAVLVIDLDASATLFGYGGSPTMAPPGGGPPIAFGTPILTLCPEPSSFALVALGIAGLGGARVVSAHRSRTTRLENARSSGSAGRLPAFGSG